MTVPTVTCCPTDDLQRAVLHVRVVARDELAVDDVVDDDVHAVGAARARRHAHDAVGDRLDRRAVAGGEVDALVHPARAHAEAVADRHADRERPLDRRSSGR